MGAFLVSDILISKYFSIEDVSLWAFLKSILILAATVSILGLDQVLLRRPNSLYVIWSFMLFRVIVLVFLISLLILCIKSMAFLYIFFSILALALLSLYYSVFRGSLKMNRAQFALNLWKIIFLILVLLVSFKKLNLSVDTIILISVLFSLFSIILISSLDKSWLKFYKNKHEEGIPPKKRLIISEANNFFIQAIGLNLSINFEQLVLNSLGLKESSATLFVHFTVFIPIVVFLNGFIGFYLAPYLRENKDKINRALFNKINFLFVILGLTLSLISIFIGSFLFDYFYSDRYDLDLKLSIAITILGFFRLYYIIPSAFVGMLACTKQLILFSRVNIVSILISLIIFVTLLNFGFNPAYSVMISSIINWMTRVFLGLHISYKRF